MFLNFTFVTQSQKALLNKVTFVPSHSLTQPCSLIPQQMDGADQVLPASVLLGFLLRGLCSKRDGLGECI